MRTAKLSNKTNGFTLLEIMIVVAIVGMLATIAVCSVMTARDNSRIKIIQHNLTKIEAAKEEWAFSNPSGATIADIAALSDFFHSGAIKQVVQETYLPNQVGIAAEAVLPASVALGPYAAGASIPAP